MALMSRASRVLVAPLAAIDGGPECFSAAQSRRNALSQSRAVRLAVLAGTVIFGACRAEAPPYALDVVGTDYALLVPDTVPAGPAVLAFENRGKKPHEVVLARIRPEVSNREFADSLLHGARMVPVRASGSGVLFAAPGKRNDIVRLRTVFTRGERYALWCQFRDTAGAPKHDQMGMFKLLSVR